MTRLFLLRHGQTSYNLNGRITGLNNPALSMEGQRQAAALAFMLGKCRLDHIITSPQRRARQTAAVVANGASTLIELQLRDRDYGPWAGLHKHDVGRRFGRVDNAPGIEAGAVFVDRVVSAVMRVVQAYPQGTLALVSHTAVNRAILGWFILGWRQILPRVPQRPGCWNCIEINGDHCELIAVNRSAPPEPMAARTTRERLDLRAQAQAGEGMVDSR